MYWSIFTQVRIHLGFYLCFDKNYGFLVFNMYLLIYRIIIVFLRKGVLMGIYSVF